jgi:hypothetical protein
MSNDLIDSQILPLDNDQVLHRDQLPRITRAAALMTYNFLMTGMVARLHLFLFGEIDKEDVDTQSKAICERRVVFDQIIDHRVPPLRAIYDFLVKEKMIAVQEMPEEASIFLDQSDTLQTRILTIDNELDVYADGSKYSHSYPVQCLKYVYGPLKPFATHRWI